MLDALLILAAAGCALGVFRYGRAIWRWLRSLKS